MTGYSITFEYDVDAGSPEEAAATAYDMITDPAGPRPMAQVKGTDGTDVLIDLDDEDEDEE
jgi:hypothetical protein